VVRCSLDEVLVGRCGPRVARTMKSGVRGLDHSLRSKKKRLLRMAARQSRRSDRIASARTTVGGAAQPQLHSGPGDRPRYLGVLDR
jgi:hypothetical protein